MSSTKEQVAYTIEKSHKELKQDVRLDVIVDKNGQLTIRNPRLSSIDFREVSPDLIETVAKAMLDAVEIARKEQF